MAPRPLTNKMSQLLSPKQVANSIGVSESSLKRWCDQGLIPSGKTPGGHRRLHVGDVLEFLRETNRPLVKPELIGLPAGSGRASRSCESSQELLAAAVSSGDEARCRRILLDHYLAGAPVVQICENLITPVMHQLGDGWECGDLEIYQERRACEIFSRLLYDLRAIMPRCSATAPLAIGGAPHQDHYQLPTTMVEMTLMESGWHTESLGANLPYATLLAAAQEKQPKLFWLSVTHASQPEELATEIESFASELPAETKLYVGGRAFEVGRITEVEGATLCRSLAELVSLVAIASETVGEPTPDTKSGSA